MTVYPSSFFITSGKGESQHELISFDNALIDAGISNYNLIRVSSILPIGCRKTDEVTLKYGSPLLTAYACISSDAMGERLAAAIGVGMPANRGDVGLIMEYSAVGLSEDESRNIVEDMVCGSMANHGIELESILISSVAGVVSEGYMSLIAAVALW